MRKCLNLHGTTGRSTQAGCADLLMEFLDHGEIQFPCQDDTVAPLGIEFEGLEIRNGQLGGQVDFQPKFTGA
jgi:hypothetical protein